MKIRNYERVIAYMIILIVVAPISLYLDFAIAVGKNLEDLIVEKDSLLKLFEIAASCSRGYLFSFSMVIATMAWADTLGFKKLLPERFSLWFNTGWVSFVIIMMFFHLVCIIGFKESTDIRVTTTIFIIEIVAFLISIIIALLARIVLHQVMSFGLGRSN